MASRKRPLGSVPYRQRPDHVYQNAYGCCPACGKHAFETRAQAKRAARIKYPHDRMSVYQCRHPGGQGWHYGHTNWRRYRDYQNAVALRTPRTGGTP